MFGLPAALAMYMTAKPERKKRQQSDSDPGGAFFAAGRRHQAIEFSFLFVAPLLFVVHAVPDGYRDDAVLPNGLFAIGANGIIDFILYNLPLGTEKSNWPMYIVVRLIMFALYFVVFRFLILRFNMKTPGREDEDRRRAFTANRSTRAKGNNDRLGESIVVGLGGRENIEVVDNCCTRLRVTVKDVAIIDEPRLKRPAQRDYQTR